MNETISNRKKQSICIISASPLTIYFFLKPHIKELSKSYAVTLIYDPANDSYLGDLNLNVQVLPVRMARKLNPFKDLLSLYDLYQIFRVNKFDLVLSVAPKAGLLAMISAFFSSNAIRVHIFQGEYWASKTGFLRLILKKSDYLTALIANKVLAVSDSEKRFLVLEGIVSDQKITVLGDGSIGGVDIERHRFSDSNRQEVRRKLNIPQDATVLLFIGRIVPDKGVYELTQAFSQCYLACPNLYLLLVGPDEDGIGKKLVPKKSDLQDRFRMVGFTEHPEEYFSSADIFCLPSYREGFPVSILEAAAAGIPSIGTEIYGISDAIINGVTGVLVQPRNIQSLVDAITYLYQEPDIRRTFGKNALDRVTKSFGENAVVHRYVQYFSNSIKKDSLSSCFLFFKRVFDLVISFLALCCLCIPMILIALGIRLSSKGPVVFWSDRIGRDNKIFRMAKFRSMKIETPPLATDLLKNPDQFITSFGNFLRRSSLDEVPQLWNILKGDMSLVGPRPALFNQYELIQLRSDSGVSQLRPGLTGWAQVNGRDTISNDEKLRFDLEYLKNACFLMDLKIIFMTFLKVIRADGVHH